MIVAPIRSRDAYEAALNRASKLIAKSDSKSLDELEVLQAVIERWERSQLDLPSPTPVEAIRFRLAQLGLTHRDLEPFIGTRSRVSEVLSGVRPLSIDMIRALTHHLGIPAASLIGNAKREVVARQAPPSTGALNKLRTLNVMRARETVQDFVARAFGGAPQVALLRKTRTDRTNTKTDLAALEAWCAAVLVKSNSTKLPKAVQPASDATAKELARLSLNADGPAQVSEVLRTYGIIFVALEHLPGTYLDGAAMRRATDGTPIIAMTLRHDRLDNFWFTLLHEYCHVIRHLSAGTPVIVDDLDINTSNVLENEADKFAQDTLIARQIWNRCASDELSTEALHAIAEEAQIHPAVVAGRWQREHRDFRRFSKLLGRGEVRRQFFKEA